MEASDFSDLCQQSIVWQQMISRDSYGKPTYAAPVVFSPFTSPVTGGRREFKTVRKFNGPGLGVDFVQGSIIYLLATPPIGLEDLVYVQGDTAPYPPILATESPADETGTAFYTKITLGNAKG